VRQYGWNAICLMPTNLYGPGDNFSETDSHVLPGLLRRFDEAKRTGAPSVMIWGTGTPRREFLHVDDLAAAAVYLMERYDSPEPLNVGTGEDLSIAELAAAICETVGYEGDIVYDPSKPDGTPRKLLDVHRVHALGWRHRISLAEGLKQTYVWYLENRERVRR
jgi:GDP-L-fucose synthase